MSPELSWRGSLAPRLVSFWPTEPIPVLDGYHPLVRVDGVKDFSQLGDAVGRQGDSVLDGVSQPSENDFERRPASVTLLKFVFNRSRFLSVLRVVIIKRSEHLVKGF